MTSTAQILAFSSRMDVLIADFSFMAPSAVVALVLREIKDFAPGLLDNDKSSENFISAWIEKDVLDRLAKIK